MPISMDQFVRNLADSGLMTSDEIQSFQAGLHEAPQEAVDLAQALVQQGRLTSYQAKMVKRGGIMPSCVFDEENIS